MKRERSRQRGQLERGGGPLKTDHAVELEQEEADRSERLDSDVERVQGGIDQEKEEGTLISIADAGREPDTVMI